MSRRPVLRDEERHVAQASLDTYGIRDQANIAMEECAELIQAISHHVFRQRKSLTKETTRDNLAGEIADVRLCLHTLSILVGDRLVDKKVEQKIARIIKKLQAKCECTQKEFVTYEGKLRCVVCKKLHSV